ncbi:MAG: Fic family protein [Patescibacteria group bacterium]|nr:Fic family protein [Patescibacteria group bacterium]
MKTLEKLQIIKRLSGLTQEKLAKELGVSFVTLNSWINGKSKPQLSKVKNINKLFFSVSGIQPEEGEEFDKKILILKKRNKYKSIIRHIINRSDLYDQFVLSLTYNTNHIEGSTLSEDETAAVLFRNETIYNKSLVEHLEVKNHQTAIRFLFNELVKGNKIEEKLILKLHEILLKGIRDDAGFYRRCGVRIVGSNAPTANYLKVPSLMADLILEINKQPKDIISHVAYIHSRFEAIHPFSDGDGRVGRLIMSAMLILHNFPPAIVKAKEKKFYLSYLRKSQLNNDFFDLENFICDSVLNSYQILEN